MLTIKTTDASVVRVRSLPIALHPTEIKSCVHRFGASTRGAAEIEISDLDGRTVMIRSASELGLERSWEVLLRTVEMVKATSGAVVSELSIQARGASNSQSDSGSPPVVSSQAPGLAPVTDLTADGQRTYYRPAALLDHPELGRFSSGRLYLTGKVAELAYGIDRLFLDFASSEGAESFFCEPIWDEGDLPGFGYAPASPMLARIRHLDSEGQYLQNATCDNIWKSLAGTRLTSMRVRTIMGTCYRVEPASYFLLERMKVFRMREIVAAGRRRDVMSFRARGVDFVTNLVRRLGLNAFIEEANDPFFLSDAAGSAQQPALDLPDQVKFELRLRLYDDKSLACASMNVHGDFFSQRFGMTLERHGDHDGTKDGDGEAVAPWTSCIAFGIERWVWAILVQYGPDHRAWPTVVRALTEDVT